jgi:hypothetical protein
MMTTCDSVGKGLSLFLYGELSFDEEEQFEQHLEACPACRGALERERQFQSVLDQAAMPLPPDLLAQCRRQFRGEVVARQQAHPSNWWDRLRTLFTPHPAWSPLAATALLTLGFVAGKFIGPPMGDGGAAGAGTANQAALLGPVAQRVRTVEPAGAGLVRIVVEETRQQRFSGGMQDARIRQLLLEAAREADDPGLRVESMEILRSHTESAEVRGALLASLEQDPNPGVRLKAIEALKPFSQEPGTRKALARVLLADDNPGVRIQAIDLLIQRTEPGMAPMLQELLEKEPNSYVRQRCERALRDMNASVETF